MSGWTQTRTLPVAAWSSPKRLSAVLTAGALALMVGSAAAQLPHEMPRPADPARLASASLILDITRTSQNWVAVGERGHVLLSVDGKTWQQAQFVPAQATLTRVSYVDERLWAVGHDTTILHSYDYGQTWSLQHFDPDSQKPLLDVHFFDRASGLAIGAFGLFMRTSDGGRNWNTLDMADLVVGEAIDWEAAAEAAGVLDESDDDDWLDDEGLNGALDDDLNGALDGELDAGDWMDEDDAWLDDDLNDEDDFGFDQGCYQFMECHLNAFVDLGDGRQMIAAERGYGFRSVDGGETWEAFMFPYQGSMFGILAGAEGRIAAFGLRGFVQISENFGDDWEVLDFGLRSTLKGGTHYDEGRVLLVGSGSTRLLLDLATGLGDVSEDRLGTDFVAVERGPDGLILFGGADGLSHE